MAFSYTKANGETGYMDGSIQIQWYNEWTVKEVTPTVANTVRLEVKVTTTFYHGYPLNYTFYSTDTISYGSETVTIHGQSVVNASYNYTTYVNVPRSWIGKTVRLKICYKQVDVTFNAVGAVASTITASNGTFGTAMTITLTQDVSGVQHTLTAEFPAGASGAATATIATSNTSKSFSWTPALATFAPKIPSATSGTMRFKCTSVLDGTTLGTTTKDVTVSIASNAALPTKKNDNWVTFTPSNTGLSNTFDGVWIQGYSKAVATFNSSNINWQYSATAKSYSITYGGTTDSTSPYETAVLNTASASITCKATDSRNKVLSESRTITLQAYSSPTITNVSVYRSNSSGTASDSGTSISIIATANVSSITKNSSNINTATFQYRIRTSGGTWPNTWTTLTSGTRKTVSTYSADSSFDVQIRLYDVLRGSSNAVTVTKNVPSQKWAMKFRSDGNGVAFGKNAETSGFLDTPWAIRGGSLRAVSTNMTDSTPSETDTTWSNGALYLFDNAGTLLGYMQPTIKAATDGRQGLRIAGRRYINGTAYDGWLEMGSKPDGTRYVETVSPIAWRRGLLINYAKGDTASFTSPMVIAPGHVTSDTKRIQLVFTVSRSLEDISSISVTSLKGPIRHTNGGYVDSSTYNANQDWLSGYTVTASKSSFYQIKIQIDKSSAFTGPTNNTPVMGELTASFSFS